MVTADSEDKRPPSPAGQGLSAQQVAELMQMLAATKLKNERLGLLPFRDRIDGNWNASLRRAYRTNGCRR